MKLIWKKKKKRSFLKKQKHEEYPNINWDNLFDKDVQLATLIYNDRIVTWKQMKQLDEQLDEKATTRMVTDMAELRIRNLLAFEELTSFNDTGAFRCKHPLVAHKSERAELEDLLKKNPAEFLRKHKNVLDNVRRYESFIKRDDREAKRKTDRNLLRKHKEREAIFRTILEKNNDETTNNAS